MKRCTRCILPETYPNIKFNKKGICNFCLNYKPITVKGRAIFEREIKKYKQKSRSKYDCCIGFSGGRDSTYLLYRLVKIHKLKVLVCTFKCGIQSPLGSKNAKKVVKKLNVDHLVINYKIKKNIKMLSNNFRAWLKKPSVAMIPILMLADKTMEYHLRSVCVKNNLSLMLDAESAFEWVPFKSGFLGVNLQGHNLSTKLKIKLLLGYLREYVKNPKYFTTFDLIENLFGFYVFFEGKNLIKKIKLIRYFDYFMWNEREIVSTIKKELNWETAKDTLATWRIDDLIPPLYNFLYYKMVGFTENDELRSNMIRNNQISREEALKIINEENKIRWSTLKRLFDEVLNLPLTVLNKVPLHKDLNPRIFQIPKEYL